MFVKKFNLVLVLFFIFVFGASAQNIRVIDNKGTLQTFNPWRLNGNTGTTEPLAPAIYGTSPIGSTQSFLGTTDSKSLVFGTNNIERLRINTLGQVGIGTATPLATLDIAGLPASTSSIDGIIAPRLTGDQLFAKGSIYGAAQTGAIVYVTAAASLANQTSITSNVTTPGYFYFDGIVWKQLQTNNIYNADGTLTANRTVTQGTNTLSFNLSPTTGTSHFTVDGTTFNIDAFNNRIGLGTATPTQVLDVVGNVKFSGALMPNNLAGSAGQVLASAGAGTAPIWKATTDLTVTNNLSSAVNTLTSTVNGVSTSANIINSNNLSISGKDLTSTVNGVSKSVDLTPLLTSATTNVLSLSGNNLTSNVNGVSATTQTVSGVVNQSTANSLTTSVNGVSSASVNIINSNIISSAVNTLTSTVNGVSTSANIINSNTLTATNGQLVSTVNGVSSAASVNILASANNGLTATNGNVQLGGTLITPTTLVTSASNTLALTGLQDGAATDNILVTDASTNQLEKVSANTIIKGNVFRYTITAADVTAGFATIPIPSSLQSGDVNYFQLVTLESANSQTYTVSNKQIAQFRLNLGSITAGDIVNVMIIK